MPHSFSCLSACLHLLLPAACPSTFVLSHAGSMRGHQHCARAATHSTKQSRPPTQSHVLQKAPRPPLPLPPSRQAPHQAQLALPAANALTWSSAGTPTGASSLQQRRDSASFLRSKSFSERSRHGSFGSLERLAAFAQASPTAAALLAREPSLEAEACSMRAAALPMNEAVRQDSISSLATSPSMHGGQLLAAAGQPGTQLSSVVLVDDAPDMTQPLGATRVPLAADEKAPLLGAPQAGDDDGCIHMHDRPFH